MKYDAIIIGFGKGGKTLAGLLGNKGKKVAVIEESKKMYGGTCINVGCLPTKSLVKNADLAAEIKETDFQKKKTRYRDAIAEKNALTAMLRKKNYDKLASIPTVDIIDGKASFKDAHHVTVQTEEDALTLKGEKIFINTGSIPFVPPIPGVEGNPHVFVSESLLDYEELPQKLTIIGGGFIGLEFAASYAAFGSDVTVIEGAETFIAREDRDLAQNIQESLEKKGVKILVHAKTLKIEEDSVIYSQNGVEETITETKILIATGRKPNSAELKLENAGVKTDERGLIIVDDLMKTNVDHIWAMGDVASVLQFTYISLDDYRIVASQVVDGIQPYKRTDRKNVPNSAFLSPTFSRVGLTEAEAQAQGLDYRIYKMPAAAIPKAQVLKKPIGMLKAMVDNKTNHILGCVLFCEESHEMINIVKLAMDAKLGFEVLRDNIYTHPTMSEGLNDLFTEAFRVQ
ncbi:MAG: FAD-dependent oxidoreductase [Eubacteriaceae bacterium]|jgi:pyruvate/2-oxoglutarate dehydrogenase complex dihydrolipoamide dehydrogenase (E3) component|nr:FAD-dependent oxidoreductase [Eubacteriaceae bacterium]